MLRDLHRFFAEKFREQVRSDEVLVISFEVFYVDGTSELRQAPVEDIVSLLAESVELGIDFIKVYDIIGYRNPLKTDDIWASERAVW